MGEQAGGSAAVLELTVPSAQRLGLPHYSHDHYEEMIYTHFASREIKLGLAMGARTIVAAALISDLDLVPLTLTRNSRRAHSHGPSAFSCLIYP